MKLEHIPQPGGAAVDLVPSRYAVEIGDLEVIVISDGILPLPTSTMSTNVDPDTRTEWFKEQFLGPDKFDWGLNVMVVRTKDKVILVDAGLGGQFEGFPRAGLLPQRLASAGIDIESITDVIVTHMHVDHVGGLLVDEVKRRLRPDVRIHVSAAEVAFWKAPDFSRTVMPAPIPDVLKSTAAEFAKEYGSRLIMFEERTEVVPGVMVERTGGHTPGHSVVRVASGGDQLVFAGDALFPVAFDHPDWQNGFEHDPETAVEVRVRLLDELAASRGLLVATHLSFPSVGRVAKEGEAYRWIPAFWDY